MEKNEILNYLKQNKESFIQDGITILGLFGSYARDEAVSNSDIDILIDTNKKFLEKYRGFQAFIKLDEIKEILKQDLNKEIDIVDKQGLIQHNNHYILDKAIYV
ncbi:MAG: nucleotidyltransferase domain-containing protein [Campylobacterales bacterium]|nr:nucleotidyltransferase domain-containing protein [Campylobacterales bacterium]